MATRGLPTIRFGLLGVVQPRISRDGESLGIGRLLLWDFLNKLGSGECWGGALSNKGARGPLFNGLLFGSWVGLPRQPVEVRMWARGDSVREI